MKPLLSIITINLNNREGLKATLESIGAQKASDFELIVVDGASTDGSTDVIRAHRNIITASMSEPDKGIYNAMNKGVRLAKGNYCYFLNSGDTLYTRNTIARMLRYLQGDFHTVAFNVIKTNSHGKPYRSISPRRLSLPFLALSALNHQAVAIRRDALLNNPYDEQLKIVSDWKFFLEEYLKRSLKYRHVDITIARYQPGGISAANTALLNAERKAVLKENNIDPWQMLDSVPWQTVNIHTNATQSTRRGRLMLRFERIIAHLMKIPMD